MKTTIKVDDSSLDSLKKTLSREEKESALSDAGQVIINSTQVGFVKRTGPDGKEWPKNPEWYSRMKKGAAVLTGPTTKNIGGPLGSRYEFLHVNQQRMKNSLRKTVTQDKVVIDYEPQAQKRAELTQFGGEAKMMLASKTGGENIELNLKIQKRPHLGVADKVPRLGSKTDSDHVADIFSEMIDKHLK